MEPAHNITDRLGGESVVADITGRSVTSVYRWQYPKEKGGTGGTIPQRHHRALLDFAKQNRIKLKAEDFLPAEEV